MKPVEEIDWFSHSDRLGVLNLCKSICEAVSESAYFNWSEITLIQEIETSKCLLFKINKNPVAFICFKENADLIDIIALGTEPLNQKKALMVQLLSFLKAHAAKQNKKIILEVHQGNLAAIRLYNRLSFTMIHERKNYYTDHASAFIYEWASGAE